MKCFIYERCSGRFRAQNCRTAVFGDLTLSGLADNINTIWPLVAGADDG
jgi:hypothetical protein